ncbi:MAG TPA: hypothetical protein DCR44_03825 [Acholeplasmatales bacterium]|nr:MAG: hypothetical protein A2Y16_01470 [Tenericutes bacterium GWF2_57_13]HAQ56512.1 hypothetical protein [Acholeplasmatales bacterium]
MSRAKNILLSTFILVVALTLAVYPVYAWFAVDNTPSVAEIRAGEVKVETTLEGSDLSGGIAIEDLLYVDFSEDIIYDRTGTLNTIATGIVLEVEALDGTIPIKNEIALVFPEGQDELLYVIVWEGLNLDETHVNLSDYHTFLLTLVAEGITDEATWRAAIAAHNASVLAMLADFDMTPGDTARIQIVFWGDYDQLVDPTGFLTLNYSVQLHVKTVQAEKE